MTRFLMAVAAAFLFTTTVQAATVFQCSVDSLGAYKGARVNLIKTAKGELRANLIFGTTVSGHMFSVSEIAPGIFQGAVKGKKDKYQIKLFVSNVPAENGYVRGAISQVEVTYADRGTVNYFKSSATDGFVCGKKIRNFR